MVHHQKGVIGLFVQQSQRVFINNVVVENTRNWGAHGSDACGPYHSSDDGGGPAAGDDHLGYTGNQAYGIVVTTSTNVEIQATTVSDVYSDTADSHGVRIFNECVVFISLVHLPCSAEGADRCLLQGPHALYFRSDSPKCQHWAA